MYLTALEAFNNGSLLITSLSIPFYQRFLSTASVGIYSENSTEFNAILLGMITFGDSFLSTVQQHAFQNGSISEEFDRSPLRYVRRFMSRYTGYCVGARDLTWSYVAFQTASDARRRLMDAVGPGGIQLQNAARSRAAKRANGGGDGWGQWVLMRAMPTLCNWAFSFLK